MYNNSGGGISDWWATRCWKYNKRIESLTKKFVWFVCSEGDGSYNLFPYSICAFCPAASSRVSAFRHVV